MSKSAHLGHWRVYLTARGVFMAVAGAAGLVTAIWLARQDLLFVGLLLETMVVGSLAGGLIGPRAKPMSRILPLGVVDFDTHIDVVLVGRAGKRDVVEDVTEFGVAVARPAGTGAYGYGLTAGARGAFQIGPARLFRLAPFAVARFVREICPAQELLVAPELFAVPVPQLRFDLDETSAKLTATAIRVTDPTSVRDYQPGDPRRLVHWRATARRAKLMVRGDKPKAVTDIWLVVSTVEGPGFEAVLSAAASLLRELTRSGHAVRVMTTGGLAAGPFAPGPLDQAWEFFARLTPEQPTGTWVDLIAAALPSRGGQVPLLAVADDVADLGLERATSLADPAVVYLANGQAPAGWQAMALPRRAPVLRSVET